MSGFMHSCDVRSEPGNKKNKELTGSSGQMIGSGYISGPDIKQSYTILQIKCTHLFTKPITQCIPKLVLPIASLLYLEWNFSNQNFASLFPVK